MQSSSTSYFYTREEISPTSTNRWTCEKFTECLVNGYALFFVVFGCVAILEPTWENSPYKSADEQQVALIYVFLGIVSHILLSLAVVAYNRYKKTWSSVFFLLHASISLTLLIWCLVDPRFHWRKPNLDNMMFLITATIFIASMFEFVCYLFFYIGMITVMVEGACCE